MSRFAQIIVDLSAEALDRFFTYEVPEKMKVEPGQEVVVPFGPRKLQGFVVRLTDSCDLPPEKIRAIESVYEDYPAILPEQIRLAEWIHSRYLCNLVDALRLMIPAEMRGGRVHARLKRYAHLAVSAEEAAAYRDANRRAVRQAEVLETLEKGACETSRLNTAALNTLAEKGLVSIDFSEVRRVPSLLSREYAAKDYALMPAQARAVNAINAAVDAGSGRFLLYGVTGSGKTEVYIHAIRHTLELGKGAIVLVPEISLTPQMVSWFHARFGNTAAVLHSALSAGERYDEWRRIRSGEARVVVGARSAVFAPMEDPGLIIVDEEHESTYQSDSRPRYDAREIAWHRGEETGAVLVLGSATPSIATFMKANPGVKPENHLTLLEMRERVNGRPLPEVEIVDMRGEIERGNNSIFSARLSRKLNQCLNSGEQAILLMNRRGYATFVSCRKCGESMHCPHCDISLTYHMTDNTLKCHYCGYEEPKPSVCPKCGSRYIKFFGMGTQKVADEAQKLFPQARIVRMDNDTTRGKDAHEKLLESFRSGEANLLIGTQMIAKGHDFPNVTLVGVVAADASLELPDYRSVERTFQLLTQVAGRAGRGDKPGHVLIQTYKPEHYAVQLAAKQDYRAFYYKEFEFRRASLYPPFTQIIRLVYTGRDPQQVELAALEGEKEIREWLESRDAMRDVIHLRTKDAPVARIRDEYRWHVFLKVYFKGDIRGICEEMQAIADTAPEGVRAELEVNPVSLI